jgi:hypothetical protein
MVMINGVESMSRIRRTITLERWERAGPIAATPPRRVVIAVPRDWWQAVRQRWCPAWWLRRYPVLETTHVVESRMLLPEVPLPPALGRTFQHVWVEEIHTP